jgi:hypothetical protein
MCCFERPKERKCGTMGYIAGCIAIWCLALGLFVFLYGGLGMDGRPLPWQPAIMTFRAYSIASATDSSDGLKVYSALIEANYTRADGAGANCTLELDFQTKNLNDLQTVLNSNYPLQTPTSGWYRYYYPDQCALVAPNNTKKSTLGIVFGIMFLLFFICFFISTIVEISQAGYCCAGCYLKIRVSPLSGSNGSDGSQNASSPPPTPSTVFEQKRSAV